LTELPFKVSLTEDNETNGGQTTFSTLFTVSSWVRKSPANFTASLTVVFIFQLPAIIGTRIVLPPVKDKIINRTIPMYHRKREKEKLTSSMDN
jgi:hypothetical protein